MLLFYELNGSISPQKAMVVKTLVVGSFAANCYVVGSSSTMKGMIIDPGAEAATILRTVQQMGLSVSLIVITHAHIDHVGAVRAVNEKTHAQFALHEAEKGLVFASPMRMLTALGLTPVKSPPQPDRLLKDGDRIDVDERTMPGPRAHPVFGLVLCDRHGIRPYRE